MTSKQLEICQCRKLQRYQDDPVWPPVYMCWILRLMIWHDLGEETKWTAQKTIRSLSKGAGIIYIIKLCNCPVFSYWFNGVSSFKRRTVGNSIGKSISNAIQLVKYHTCNIRMKTSAFQNSFPSRKVAFPTTWDAWWDWNIAIPKVQTTHVQPGPAGMHQITNFQRL